MCIPYPRKGVYWMISLPYLVLMILTASYLWNFSEMLAIVYVGFYLLTITLHGYICSFSECPYKGKVCPGAFAWFPVGKIAGIFQRMKIKKSEIVINIFFLFILLAQLGILILPIYWIYKLDVLISIGYIIFILFHFFIFVLMICPRCAQRNICPTAKLSNKLNLILFSKDIFNNIQ